MASIRRRNRPNVVRTSFTNHPTNRPTYHAPAAHPITVTIRQSDFNASSFPTMRRRKRRWPLRGTVPPFDASPSDCFKFTSITTSAHIVTATLAQTPLFDWHAAHGGRLVDFAAGPCRSTTVRSWPSTTPRVMCSDCSTFRTWPAPLQRFRCTCVSRFIADPPCRRYVRRASPLQFDYQ